MTRIRKDQPGSAGEGYEWEHAGDVVDVEDETVAGELLAIPGFSRADGDEDDNDVPDRSVKPALVAVIAVDGDAVKSNMPGGDLADGPRDVEIQPLNDDEIADPPLPRRVPVLEVPDGAKKTRQQTDAADQVADGSKADD
jgi:hypothetical protein